MTREISLGFGGEQYFHLVVAGLTGMIPNGVWLMMLTLPFGLEQGPIGVVGGIGVALMMFMLVVAPWLAAVLILRARQPLGARISWDDELIIEWDGPDQRAVIPWRAAVASQREWVVQLKSGPHTERAIQLFDPNTKVAISVWSTRPDGVPFIRRRLTSDGANAFRDTIVSRGLTFEGEPQWSRAFEPARPPHELWSRFGYLAAVAAPLAMPMNAALGVGLSALAAALLTLRALPVFRELKTLTASPWDQRKRRAVVAEAFVRSTFVVLVIYSGWASHAFLNPD